MARLYIGAGRTAKVRPADLVGAIANEAGIDGASAAHYSQLKSVYVALEDIEAPY